TGSTSSRAPCQREIRSPDSFSNRSDSWTRTATRSAIATITTTITRRHRVSVLAAVRGLAPLPQGVRDDGPHARATTPGGRPGRRDRPYAARSRAPLTRQLHRHLHRSRGRGEGSPSGHAALVGLH